MPGATTAKKPVIRKSVKQARQALTHGARNRVFQNEMKSLIKLFVGYIQKKDAPKAAKLFPRVVSIIDKNFKKNLLHRNNAANKKSRLQKMLTVLIKSGATPVVEAPKAPKVAKVPKAPKTPKVEKEAKEEKPAKKVAKKEEKKA
jgi:small subunit ribosomal protein S20